MLAFLCCFPAFLSLTLGADPLGPGAGPWDEEKPEDHGLATAGLDAIRDTLWDHFFERKCFAVVKDGALVYEWYFQPFIGKDTAIEAQSMTKTLGALIAGVAATHAGFDIDADITAAYGVPSPRPYNVTARQIMSQALAGEHGPGEKWEYDTQGTRWIDTLPGVIKSATGHSAGEIWQKIMDTLGLSKDFKWDSVNEDWSHGSFGSCRDFARVGQLMLNGGRWRDLDVDLVSPAYVQAMGTPQTRYAPYTNYSNPCYGLLTWINGVPGSNTGSQEYPGTCQMWPEKSWFPKGSPSDVYFAAGVWGQITMVVPEHKLVLVSMGYTLDDYAMQRLMYEGVCKLFPGDGCSGSGLAAEAVV